MSDTTRDWLLKKLLEAERAIAEQQVEIRRLNAQREVDRNAYTASMREYAESNEQLIRRVHEMAPERQFQIVYRGPQDHLLAPLKVLSVSSTNGKTLIHVTRQD